MSLHRFSHTSQNNSKVTSLEGLSCEVHGDVILSGLNVTSLHNVHKFIHQCDGTFRIDSLVEHHVLGLLLVRGCNEVNIGDIDVGDYRRLNEIFNKYLPNTRGNAAVNECQDELIEADLEDFAEL